LFGLALTVLTLLAFTRNWRSTVVAAVVIPASLVAGFFFMNLSGFTINSMTLLAMATALGTLIANAIVLIESALGELNAGRSPDDAAIDGAKKALVPIMASTGTNLVVFLPIAFMGGIAGQFMVQFGLMVVYLTFLSLMFSFSLTPMMIAKVLKVPQKKDKSAPRRPSRPSDLSWFRPFFSSQLARPWRTVGLSFLILVLSVIPLRWVGNEFSPAMDIDEITITARAPAGATFQKTAGIARRIEASLARFPEIKSTAVKIGERGMQNMRIRVGLVPRSARAASDKEIARKILPALSDIPGAEIQVIAGRQMGTGDAADLALNVYGPDDGRREEYAARVLEMLNQIPEIQSAVRASQKPGEEIRFVPDPAKMKFWGANNAMAASALRAAIYGNDSNKYKEGGEEYPIVLELAKEYKSGQMFDSVFVQTPKGLVALSELGRVEFGAGAPDIRRIDKARVTEISIILGKSTIGPVQAEIERNLSRIEWAPGYAASFGGMSEIQSESQGEMGNAFMLATILTLMILAALMNSMTHPVTIATSILFSFAGVFAMLFLAGASINIAAMLSAVMLVGLTVNNNILLLEPAIARIGRGESAAAALWAEFIDKKRMILMTTIAVAAGMAPQLWSADGVKASMGAVIIGGMGASLFWTFFMTPAVFVLMERLRARLSGK
jgi:HAE1 family hydrophobic/amphiphilic exporter-1